MKTLSIRRLEEKDIEFAHRSTMIEEWNRTGEDIQRMFKLNPLGCFTAELEGKRAGHVFSIGYGKLGWIGFLIVRAEYRERGVGTSLMKKAMDHLLSNGVETTKLEAVPAIAGLYRKLGFTDEYDSLRFSGNTQKFLSAQGSNVKSLKREMIKEIAKWDAEYFGAERTKVLTSLYNDNPNLCFLSYTGSKVAGYIMCRRAGRGHIAGPWVCSPEKPQVAKGLLIKSMEAIGRRAKLYVGVPALNREAVEILREFGFEQYSKSIRMRLGKELETECINGIFAIGGAEKG